MAVTSAWRRRAETVARLLAALAIPVVIAFAWRHGLFTEIASSYLGLLASVGLIAFLLLALGEWGKAGIFLSPASVMVGVAVLAFVYYCGLTTALAAAMLALQAKKLCPRVRVFGQTFSRQIGKKQQPFCPRRHRRRFL